ncbi:MAG: helix-turn-helix domain-containing protein [Firmicutes bacterium]|nr:helix-turn-helix domain-containing protein [Clostridiales bacterium]MBE6153825.1 helix-turn-helix domain-containing protein [Bacillota bacterium]
MKNTKDARQILANNIVYYRLERGWSQEDFADRLGTTPTYVSSLENAKRNTRIDYINHICNILEIELFQLFINREKIENNRIPRRPKNM